MKNSYRTSEIIDALLSITKKTPYQLAQYLDINHTSVGYWLRTGSLPTAERLPGIAEFFNVPLEYLFSDKIPKCKEDVPFIEKDSKDEYAVSNHTEDIVSIPVKAEAETAPKIDGFILEIPIKEKQRAKERQTELIEIFVELEPKGQHLVIAAAYNQLYQQKLQKKEET